MGPMMKSESTTRTLKVFYEDKRIETFRITYYEVYDNFPFMFVKETNGDFTWINLEQAVKVVLESEA
jgi:hypothetical protein